jgi:hypothetical protein
MNPLRIWLLLPLGLGLVGLWLSLRPGSTPAAERGAAPERGFGPAGAAAPAELAARVPAERSGEAPATPVFQLQDEGPRWLPALPYREGQGRSGLELFADWWGAETERAGVSRDALPKGRFQGPLGDEVECLTLLRKALPERFVAERGGATLAELRRFPGSQGSAAPEALLEQLLQNGTLGQSLAGAPPDRSDPAWAELVQELARRQSELHGRCDRLLERMAAALREDLDACSPTRLPPRGQLNFGPLAVGPTPAAAARQSREPRAAWTTTLTVPPAGGDSPCRIYALHYTLFWEDVPDIAAELEALLAHRDSLLEGLAPRLNLLPR